MKILLIHQYAGNKGDRAVLYALVRMIKELSPQARVAVSTSDPKLWSNDSYFRGKDITFIPQAWDFQQESSWFQKKIIPLSKYAFSIMREIFLCHLAAKFAPYSLIINPAFLQYAEGSDIIISVGGHHFTTLLSRDLVSSINYDAMAACLCKKKLYAFSQSFGPFSFYNPRNRRLTKKLLTSFDGLYARERGSVEELRSMDVPPSKIHEVPETVFSIASYIQSYTLPSKREKILGISIYSTVKRNGEERASYVDTISTVIRYAAMQGYSVLLFPMELKDSEPDDRPLLTDIQRSANVAECKLVDRDLSTEEHLEAVSKCRIFIGHKTHSVIFSIVTGTPLIAIAYHQKTREFMRQLSQQEDCINDSQLTGELLISMFKDLEARADATGKKYRNKALELGISVKRAFKKILSLQ